jgi:hypothetical protein
MNFFPLSKIIRDHVHFTEDFLGIDRFTKKTSNYNRKKT